MCCDASGYVDYISFGIRTVAHQRLCPLQTASSSSTEDSDPFASRASIASTVGIVELPEIPFIASPSAVDEDVEEEVDDTASSVWLRRRPAVSTTSSERQIAILGHASERILGHCRQRSGSISSTASRPAPAKSILSSSSSIKARKGRSTPSVKFIDMPTTHFEDEDEVEDDYQPESLREPRRMKSNVSLKGKKRAFAILDWFASPKKKAKPTLPDRPLISGPLPLWEGRRYSTESERPPYRQCDSPTMTSARSIRSVKSTHSMRSVRSCASRLQGYWTRLSGRD